MLDPDKVDELLSRAQTKTNEEFASIISSLTRLTDAEISELTPCAADRQTLNELMRLVSDSTKSNQAKARIIQDTERLAEMVVPILTKLLLPG